MGCIFAELLDLYEQGKNPEGSTKPRFLFPGWSCYPLSPQMDEDNQIRKKRKGGNNGMNDERESRDLLKVICKTIGTPDQADRSFLTKDDQH